MRSNLLSTLPSLISILLTSLSTSSLLAADLPAATIEAELSKPILETNRTMNETRAFVEARVPKMPKPKSLDEWRAIESGMRSRALSEVVFKGSASRWRDAKARVEWLETVEGGPGYKIRKLRFEALPGFWVPALLYQPDALTGKKVPVVLNVNGHDSNGKAADYKQIRCINLAKRGILAMNVEWLGMGQFATPDNHHGLINHIDLCGAGGVAVHYLIMSRAFDVLLSQEHADPERVALTGLSGGGWQTIFYSAFDPRVSLCVPVAGYSSFFTRARYPTDLGDSEQTPVDLATVTDYAIMTAMLGGRSALLVFNGKDNCCFAAPHALPPLIEAARPIFKLHGREDHLQTHINQDPGTHNYLVDNRQALYRAIGSTFYPGDSSFDPKEIPSEGEVKSAAQLNVALPADNLSLQKIALNLSQEIDESRRSSTARKSKAEASADLLKVLRSDRLDASGEMIGEEKAEDRKISRWKLSLGKEWTLPAVEFSSELEARGTVLLISDRGRKAVAEIAGRWLKKGFHVIVLDPYNTGESTFATHSYLWSLFVSTVGERPLGVQAAQIAAVARWAAGRGAKSPVILVAEGPRMTTAALCAAVLEEKSIGEVELTDSLKSLKTLIEQRISFEKAPELFCFGLLEVADIPQLAEMIAPRPVRMKPATTPFPETK